MGKQSRQQRRQWLAFAGACLVAGAAPHAAAKSRADDPAAQARVKAGMTMDEVTALLGRAPKTRRYGKNKEVIWGYPTRTPETWFLVDFGADGKVKSVETRYMPPW